MKSLRKRLLTLLALTLFGGMGAWAQGPTAAELTIPASWSQDLTPLTVADLPGFVAVDSATADQWEDASTTGYAVLIYAFTTDGKAKYVRFQPGFKLWGTDIYIRDAAYEDYDHDFQVFYTTGGGAIELTKVGDNQWSLGQTPDYDLELQVEYYQKYTLDSIPLDWQVKVGNAAPVYPTAYTEGNTTLGYLTITETDSVTLIPDNPLRVKSVTLVEPVVLVNIDGITLDITGCTTWADIIARNPGVIWDEAGWIGSNSGILVLAGSVFTSDPYDPAQQATYHWQLP